MAEYLASGYKLDIIEETNGEVSDRISELHVEQNYYDCDGNSKDQLIYLAYESQIQYLHALAFIALDLAGSGQKAIFSLEDIPFGSATEEGEMTIEEFLLSSIEGLDRGAAIEAIRAGKNDAIDAFLNLVIPRQIINSIEQKIYFHRLNPHLIMRNKDTVKNDDGSYELTRETKIPGFSVVSRLDPDEKQTHRALLFE